MQVPKEASGDVSCASSVDGGEGVCVYLTRCDSARLITADIYKTTYCTVSQGLVFVPYFSEVFATVKYDLVNKRFVDGLWFVVPTRLGTSICCKKVTGPTSFYSVSHRSSDS